MGDSTQFVKANFTRNILTGERTEYTRPCSIASAEPITLIFNQSQGWVKNGECGYPKHGQRVK